MASLLLHLGKMQSTPVTHHMHGRNNTEAATFTVFPIMPSQVPMTAHCYSDTCRQIFLLTRLGVSLSPGHETNHENWTIQ